MIRFDNAAGKLWTCNTPAYPDLDSRSAYNAGYSDGWYGYERDHGDWPVQPYSKGYWEGRHDATHGHSARIEGTL